MAQLIYSAIASLDGFIEDADGNFDWAAPDEEVHAFVNDLERPVGTYLYGRRMYETMAVWDTMPLDDEPDVMRDFAELWRAADKVVYSRTLADVSTRRTRLERELDVDAVRQMKRDSARDNRLNAWLYHRNAEHYRRGDHRAWDGPEYEAWLMAKRAEIARDADL